MVWYAVVAILIEQVAQEEAVDDRRDEDDVDPADGSHLPDLAQEWIWSRVDGFEMQQQRQIRKPTTDPERNEKWFDGMVEAVVAAVFQVHYDAAQAIQTYAGIVEHESSVMNELGLRLQTVSRGAAPIQC